jgi:hypothetical protein
MAESAELTRLRADLERVRTAIAAIETDGVKSFNAGEYGGENLSLESLYERERTLMKRITRRARGNLRPGIPVR